MQVKVFKFDKNGKVSFTQAELEKLLNEVYRGGYNDGKYSNYYWTWTSPYYTWSNSNVTLTGTDSTSTNPNITWTTTTNSTDNTVTAQMNTPTYKAPVNEDIADINSTNCVSNKDYDHLKNVDYMHYA